MRVAHRFRAVCDQRLAGNQAAHAVADHRDLRCIQMQRKGVDCAGQLAGTYHQAVAVVVGETGALLAMKGEHLGQRMETPGRSVAAMHQNVDRLAGIEV